jgi:dienelactone hydrolase
MSKRFLTALTIVALLVAALGPAWASEPDSKVAEEMWVLTLPIPMMAYVVRPLQKGPLPLALMNHGESLDPQSRSSFPRAEFRAAALWFAAQGYLVVAPIRPGFGSTAIDNPETGIFGIYFGEIGDCSAPNFRDPGISIAVVNEWVINELTEKGMVLRDNTIVIGQSGGGWGALALSSRNHPSIRAIVAFAAGRGGHIDGKPNNNCAPNRLVEAAAEFGRTARIPTLWIYTENDSYFGPALSKQMFEAFVAAGGKAEYRLFPSFGNDGHFFIDAAEAIPLWAPDVTRFLSSRR